MFDPRSTSATCCRHTKTGNTATSQPVKPASFSRSSATSARASSGVLFIFQLPATNERRISDSLGASDDKPCDEHPFIVAVRHRESTKSEARNPRQIQSSKFEFSKLPGVTLTDAVLNF